MQKYHFHLTLFISAVWSASGLIAKILNRVPRHQEIVERILHLDNGRLVTILIGFAEIFLAVWVRSRLNIRLCAVCQIVIILAMNLIEFIYASDLLLWGKFNIVFAVLFCILVYCWGFIWQEKLEPAN